MRFERPPSGDDSRMRNVRALLASVGAGGSIAIAGVITLLSVSAVIAVGGWHGPAKTDDRAAAPLVVPARTSTTAAASTARLAPSEPS